MAFDLDKVNCCVYTYTYKHTRTYTYTCWADHWALVCLDVQLVVLLDESTAGAQPGHQAVTAAATLQGKAYAQAQTVYFLVYAANRGMHIAERSHCMTTLEHRVQCCIPWLLTAFCCSKTTQQAASCVVLEQQNFSAHLEAIGPGHALTGMPYLARIAPRVLMEMKQWQPMSMRKQ